MSEKIYELIIVGAGPAGITAAVYAARKKLDFVIISQDIGGQAAWSGDIENYTGYQFITGPELALKFNEHMAAFGIDVVMPRLAQKIVKEGNIIRVTTEKTEYKARAVIIATGKKPRELGIEGEKEFKNKGVTYCATCDGPLFRDKPVAIIGGGNSGLDAALQMMKISPKVYLINNTAELTGDRIMIEKLRQSTGVEVRNNTVVVRISGERFVNGIEVSQNSQVYHLSVKGVFVEIGLIPNSQCAAEVDKNTQGEIIVDCRNRTNVEGMFAAGDVTNVPEKQIIIACGEGSKACLAAFNYLATHAA
ncbi:MAG: FAD-dependent oxidoreductase [Candidatus Omnitrophica bacterium]|nr:FAD-dependent oxidoreductase [Candidatus Omnitrophota bacterium]MBU4479762.1 FAD-dependent oxidoreductase [Candidatus Omnitrophota bacterium]MCG2703285.1 FAD-dependent oxidoreductase [Candidatus Omnitrophota bacterium]